MTQVPHTDSRNMQALPWTPRKEDKLHDLVSANGKQIATFWGNDARHPQNMEWCTEAQRERHVNYASHACNAFPTLQNALEEIYKIEDLPEDAIKIIEATMENCYYEEVPPYVSR